VSGVTVRLDEITPLLERVTTAAQAQGLALVGARAVGGLVKEHLYQLDGLRSRRGSHFYRQAGDSVTTGATPTGARVSITQRGFRQRLFGGTIRPKVARMLTIPAHPDAYGKRAGEFTDLDFAIAHDPETGALRPALVRRAQTVLRYSRRKAKDGTIRINVRPVKDLKAEVMFWLVKSVTQQPDPDVLPWPSRMSERAVTAIKQRLERAAGPAKSPGDSA